MNPAFPKQMETERLVIRKYRQEDATWYYPMSLRNRSHLQRYEAENPLLGLDNEEDARKLLSDFDEYFEQGEHHLMGAFLRENDEFVTQIYVGLVDKRLPEFAIGYFVDVEHEGNGYVTEAVKEVIRVLFTEVGAHRVRSECDDTNERSIAVSERCGMVREAHFRKNKLNEDGTYSGTLFFGMLREDFTEFGE